MSSGRKRSFSCAKYNANANADHLPNPRPPPRKHIRAYKHALTRLGWKDGEPDGGLPNGGRSFTAQTCMVIVESIDHVYFRGTLVPRANAFFRRPLRTKVLDTIRRPDGARVYAVYSPAAHTISLNRSEMFRRALAPVIYEGIKHPDTLHWVMGILQHELVHMICFQMCASHSPCRQPSDAHGKQFSNMLYNIFGRGPLIVGKQIILKNAEPVAKLANALVVVTRRWDRIPGASVSEEHPAPADDYIPMTRVDDLRKRGFEVYMIVTKRPHCCVK